LGTNLTRGQIVARHPNSFEPSRMNVKVCETILLDIKEIFDAAGVPFWLWGGTLLGIYRDKGLMPWDEDIDLAVYAEDVEKISRCNDKFMERGLELGTDTNEMVLYRDGEHADLDLFRRSGGKRIGLNGSYEFDISSFETPNWVEFLGKSWRIFADPERWLQYMYGPDWRIPQSKLP